MAQRGKIDAYLDCNSPYSLYALTWLRKNKQLLNEHDVGVEFHPIFLGGLNVGSGNKPPWTLAAKAAYGNFDGPRAARYFGLEPLEAPAFFPIMTLLPMRCMLFIKDHFENERFEEQFQELWQAYWRDAMDISKPPIMLECLKRHFSDDEARRIVEGGTSPKYKKMLVDETARLVEKGAFGAPWFCVRGREGVEEPFFGSDRFAFMLRYLGVPFNDIAIEPRGGKARL